MLAIVRPANALPRSSTDGSQIQRTSLDRTARPSADMNDRIPMGDTWTGWTGKK
jgi:hypothetical protein